MTTATVTVDEKAVMRNFAARVAYARQVRGMTQQEVADRGGTCQSQVSLHERGKLGGACLWTIPRLAVGLDTTLKWLLEEGPPTGPPPHGGAREAPTLAETRSLFRERLDAARAFRGLSRAELLRRSGLSFEGPARFAGRHTGLHLRTIQRFAAVLDVPVEWLFGEGEMRMPWDS